MIRWTDFNMTEPEWIVAPNDLAIDSCHFRNAYNETENCEKWSYDRTYYGDTRATQVYIICDKKKYILKIENELWKHRVNSYWVVIFSKHRTSIDKRNTMCIAGVTLVLCLGGEEAIFAGQFIYSIFKSSFFSIFRLKYNFLKFRFAIRLLCFLFRSL